MSRVFIIAATMFVLFILQSLPAYRLTDMHLSLSWIRLQVDIACIFSVYLGVRETQLLRGTLLAFLVGILANCFAPTSMRIYTFLAPACFVFTYISNVAFFFKRFESQILLIFVMSLFYNFFFFYLMRVASAWHSTAWILFWPAILQALMNAVFGTFCFIFFDWVLQGYEQSSRQFRL